MTSPRLPDTPAPIIAWLTTLDPDAECGMRGVSDDCVLARWLETQGSRYSIVGDDYYWTNYHAESKDQHATPLWAHDFVLRSDTDDEARWLTPITAAEALAVLETLKEND